MSRVGDWFQQLKTNRRTQAFTAGFLIIILAAGAGALVFRQSDSSAPTKSGTNASSRETLVRRALDGVPDNADREHLPTVAVMIENLAAARPQSGLEDAGVVYEALAEGGITRFLAIFDLHQHTQKIGPVRSARPYYVDWAAEYDSLYAHAGGSPAGLALIRSANIRDLDQFFNSRYYWRDTKRQTAREHTLFTDSTLLARARVDKDMPAQSTYASWTYKDDAPASARPASQTLTVPFSTFNYQVEWRYSPATNTYQRFQAGAEHIMENSAAINAKNVIIMTIKTQLADSERLSLETSGSGPANIFRDGTQIDGTWTKDGRNARLSFTDATGQAIPLNGGQTWIEALPPDRSVTVT